MDMYPSAPKAPEKASEDETDTTALLPKSLFGGDCKVGDKYTVEVVAVHDDELEVKPVESKKEEKSEKENEPMDDDMMNPVDRMMG